MKILRDATEAEMIEEYLFAELESTRFNEKLMDALTLINIDSQIIKVANLESENENLLRKQVLASYRGYGINQHMFENFPNVTRWFYGECNISDIDKIHYINYSYWNELSKNTNLPRVAAQTINEGIKIYDIPNDNAIQGKKYLLDGNTFRPVILITSDFSEYIIIEGHSRMTVYGLIPEKFDKTHCYIGKCNENELRRWNGK